ncbi:peptidase S10 [bacterium]|nr:MAG: peptidase S10 [bacterium]
MSEETKPVEGKDEKKEEKKEKPELKDQIVVTQHKITLGGEDLHYTVTTGTIVLKDETDREKDYEGETAKAQFFFVAYTKDGVENPAERALTFSFNGGPGSSSVWLHLGLLGPRRVVMTDEGGLPKPPYQLVDNEFSLLDQTDLVFIDPVGTGYSRPADGEKAKQFHGFKKDIESVGDFIRLYTTRYNRWLSPKFLIGESYGTTRASGLSGYLQERHGMYLNGIMLVSTVLDFGTIDFTPGNELPYVLFLPTYAATAWYHDALKFHQPLQTLLADVQEFAVNEYAPALLKGNTLSPVERKSVLRKLARYTGLSSDYLERSNLRVPDFRFFKELLRGRGRTVGRLDSRFLGIDRDTLGEGTYNDPSFTNIIGPYTAGFYDYVRRELAFEKDIPYEIITGKVQPWSYAEYENQHVFVAETLRQAMSSNPHLKVFIANGYYDLATPFFATEYVFNHLGLDESLRGNLSMSYYEAGHMMYIHLPVLEQLKLDLAQFIEKAG